MRSLIGHAGLMYYCDGNATVVVRDDFVDLQESPAIFPKCPFCSSGDIIPPAQLYPHFSCDSCGVDFDLALPCYRDFELSDQAKPPVSAQSKAEAAPGSPVCPAPPGEKGE